MASLRVHEYKKRSKAWDHFVKRDAKKQLAECIHCNELFCYKSTSGNLRKHLEKKHNFTNKDDSINKEQLLESDYWEYYNRNEDDKKATCKLCCEELDYEVSPTAPLDHLKSRHIDETNEVEMLYEEESSDDDDVDDVESHGNVIDAGRDSRKPRIKTSIAWQYFDIEDDIKKLATCKLCGDLRSYRSTVTNLIRHLNRKHKNYDSEIAIKRECDANETTAETDAEDNTEIFASDDTKGSRRKSPIWLYFKVIDHRDKKSQCLICKKIFSYSTTVTNLKQHLRRKHPNLRIPRKQDETKTILLSANGELYEVETSKDGDLDVDQNEPEEMDTVYLEDFDTLENSSRKKRRYSMSQREYKPQPLLTTVNLHDSSSDDGMPIKNRTNDSIDHFGRYAASLLRELPKEIANKLQSDFIARIMDAHLTYEAQKRAHAQTQAQAQAEGQSKAYAITVTSVDNAATQETEESVATEVVQSEM